MEHPYLRKLTLHLQGDIVRRAVYDDYFVGIARALVTE